MTKPVRPVLSKPALKLGPLEATQVMRRKRTDFRQGLERATTLRFKAGYMIASGFSHSPIYNPAHRPAPYEFNRFSLSCIARRTRGRGGSLSITHGSDPDTSHPAFRQTNLPRRRGRQIETPAAYRRTAVVDFNLSRMAVLQVGHPHA